MQAPTDPPIVVDQLDFGVVERNADDETHDPALLEAFGMLDFVKLKTT